MSSSIKKTLTFFFALFLLLGAAPYAHAVIFAGSLSTDTNPAGLSGSGIWADDWKIAWQVESLTSGDWKYIYTLSENSGNTLDPGAISHVIFEVSPNVTTADFWDIKKDGIAVASNKISIADFTSTSNGNSNPNLPGTLHGMKIDVSDGTVYSFISNRAPVWGDFYSKDGKAGGKGPNAIWNSDILLADPTDPAVNGLLAKAGGGYYYKILRPDTTTTITETAVPEPASFSLLGLGLLGLRFARRKRV